MRLLVGDDWAQDHHDIEVMDEAGMVLAGTHKTLIWERARQVQRLRAQLREFFPAAVAAFEDLAARTRWSCWARSRTRPVPRS